MQFNQKVYDLQSLNIITSSCKVGLLGGSFNPAHFGHKSISEYGLKKMGLDYVIWLVAVQNPFKPSYELSQNERATYAANLSGNSNILVSTMESEIASSCSYDTICYFCKTYPQIKFTWMMGADLLEKFHLWEHHNKFTDLVDIAIFKRRGYSANFKRIFEDAHKNKVKLCDNDFIDISSTEIRNK